MTPESPTAALKASLFDRSNMDVMIRIDRYCRATRDALSFGECPLLCALRPFVHSAAKVGSPPHFGKPLMLRLRRSCPLRAACYPSRPRAAAACDLVEHQVRWQPRPDLHGTAQHSPRPQGPQRRTFLPFAAHAALVASSDSCARQVAT